MENEIPRWLEPLVAESLAVRRVVYLSGARQSGKTTLARRLPLSGAERKSLDEALVLESAKADPAGFVARSSDGPMVVDEIQKAKELLPAIKLAVDADRAPGQYLLTGSSDLRFAVAVRDSLAGRMQTIRLRTLAEAELRSRPPAFLHAAFRGEFPQPALKAGKADLVHAAFRGGYPEPLGFPDRQRRDWYRGYVDDLLLKDVRDVTEIRRLDALRRVVDFLAARTGKFFSEDELGTVCGLSRPVAQNYLGALEALFLFERVPAWTKTDYAKAGKRPKWYASDPGLPPNLLGWREAEARDDPDRSGKLLETWVHHELAVRADLGGWTLHHYRDAEKREIDFLVEDGEGALLGVEVKAGSVVRPDDFRHLSWFRDRLAPGPFTGIVLHTGPSTARFGNALFAVPMAALFEG
jgi:hypothetical protein